MALQSRSVGNTQPAVLARADEPLTQLSRPANFDKTPPNPERSSSPNSLVIKRTKFALGVLDLTAVLGAMVLALTLSRRTGLPPSDPQVSISLQTILYSLPVWLIVLIRNKLYQSRFTSYRMSEFKKIVSACFLGSLSLALITDQVLRNAKVDLQRDLILYTFLLTTLFVTAEREVVRQRFLFQRRRGRGLRPVVVVGDNAEGVALSRMFQDDPSLGYEFAGFVTVDPLRRHDGSRTHNVLGNVDDILEVLRRHNVGAVMIAASAMDVALINVLVRQLLKSGIVVELSPSLPDVAVERLSVRPLGRFAVMYVEPFAQKGWRSHAKRIFDMVVSAILLILLGIPLAILALLISIDSRGPVLFRQTRVGRDGTLFDVLKFRTMVPNAQELLDQLLDQNEADGPLFKIKNDPRITRLGRFLRKTSLDELPQLWNVLLGEMSLVGPRPALPAEAKLWSPELRDRLRVQPGITGMWQVNGRSNSSFEEYSRLDLYYVDNWSLISDIGIMWKTIPSVLLQRGAS